MRIIEVIENFGVKDYVFLISIVFAAYVTQFYYKYFTRVNPLPGPFPFPIIGNLPQLILHNGSIKILLEECYKKYGDLYEIDLGKRSVVLNRAEHIDKLLTPSTKSHYLLRAPHSEGLGELGIKEKGLAFNNNLKSWRYNRQFFTQAILAPKFTQEAIDNTNKLFNELTNYWDRLYLVEENRNKLNFSKWLNQFTNDMIISLLTGERSYTMAGYFNTLSDEKVKFPDAIIEDSVKLVDAFRVHLHGINHFTSINYFLRHYVPYYRRKSGEYIQNVNFISERIESTIKKRRQEIDNTPLDKPLPRDMLTSLITANTDRDVNYTKTIGSETMGPMSDIQVRGTLMDGFIGGTDTTANSISFIVYYLAHNPDAKRKVFEELDSVFQDDKTRPMTESDFHKLKYCEAVVKEVSRVMPVVPLLARYSEKPDEVAGYQWPAHTFFRMNLFIIHKNEGYWEDPEKFNPDRWLVEGMEPKKHSFVMFGGGLRICPGRKLAMIELVCLVALLYRRYDIELADMKAPLNACFSAVTTCNELLVNIKPRN